MHAEGWVEILPQMTHTLLDASHDELINKAGFEVAEVIRGVVAQAAAPTDAASPLLLGTVFGISCPHRGHRRGLIES
jgi:hypothetical protein